MNLATDLFSDAKEELMQDGEDDYDATKSAAHFGSMSMKSMKKSVSKKKQVSFKNEGGGGGKSIM